MQIKKIISLFILFFELSHSSFLEKLVDAPQIHKMLLGASATFPLIHCFIINKHLNNKEYHKNKHCNNYGAHRLQNIPYINFLFYFNFLVINAAAKISKITHPNKDIHHFDICLLYQPIKCYDNECIDQHTCQFYENNKLLFFSHLFDFLSSSFLIFYLFYIRFKS